MLLSSPAMILTKVILEMKLTLQPFWKTLLLLFGLMAKCIENQELSSTSDIPKLSQRRIGDSKNSQVSVWLQKSTFILSLATKVNHQFMRSTLSTVFFDLRDCRGSFDSKYIKHLFYPLFFYRCLFLTGSKVAKSPLKMSKTRQRTNSMLLKTIKYIFNIFGFFVIQWRDL